jgi:isopentenyl-diphosphate delta-isomerase
MQHEGDTDFSGSISRLRDIAGSIDYPVILKEVGHGIGAAAAAELVDCPIAAVDVAGAGGTSWARVEQYVRYGEIRHPALAEWGIPTAEALMEVRHMLPDVSIVASGGIRTGMDAAKVLAMGADAVAVARPLLAPAIESPAAVVDWLQQFIDELLVCLHGCGAANLAALRRRGVTEL